MKKYPNVAVKVIFRYKDEILLLKHPNGAFGFPGGRVEWRESPLEALNRELKEELNFSLEKEPRLFDIWNYVSKDKRHHTVFINFIHKLKNKPKLSSLEGDQILWLTKKEINSKNIIKERKFLDKIFRY